MLEWLRSLFTPLAMRRVPVVRIADLEDGRLVRVVGHARGLEGPLPMPLTGGDAATLTVRAYQWGRDWDLQRHRSLQLLDDVDRGDSFWIEDATGVARVERRGWSLLHGAHRAVVAGGVLAHRPSASLERYFAYFGDGERNLFRGFSGEYQYEELAIPVDARIEVVGRARDTRELCPGSRAGGYRTAQRLFALEPPAGDHLRIRLRG